MKSTTEVSSISLQNLSAVMRNAGLVIRELNAQRIELESTGRAKTECHAVRAEQWSVQCESGAFIAQEISGEMEMSGFDGKTDIGFSRFEGRTTISSGGGNITLRLPDNSNLGMDLRSRTHTVYCDFDLIGNSRQQKGHKSGYTGVSSDNYLNAQTRFGSIRVRRSSTEGDPVPL